MTNLRKYLKWSLLGLLAILLTRVFLYQSYRAGDFHMASTFLPGDRVLVNKYRAGVRLPVSILGLPGAGAPYIDAFRLPYLRLPALKKLKRQDVIVFNSPAGADKPIDRKKLIAGRIVGLPTDTVYIKDKVVMVNNKVVAPPVKARNEFRVITAGSKIPDAFLRQNDLEKPRTVADIGIFDIDLPQGTDSLLTKEEGVKTVRETLQSLGDASIDYYPQSNFFFFNRDQFGPFRVPAKGMTVTVDIKSIDFYRDMIEIQEKHNVLVDFSGVHIDDVLVTSYTFEKDYYFVMSDNRDNPNDSRKFGFIPADHVLGVATRIVWSRQNTYDYLRKAHADRTLDKIR
jgi:signal peptidase I